MSCHNAQVGSTVVVYFMLENKIGLKKGEIVFCLLTPLSQLVPPLAYMFYLNSIKKFRWEFTKSAAEEWRESWRLCCMRLRLWMGGRRGKLLLNRLDTRSSEYRTPSLESSLNYDSLGSTGVK